MSIVVDVPDGFFKAFKDVGKNAGSNVRGCGDLITEVFLKVFGCGRDEVPHIATENDSDASTHRFFWLTPCQCTLYEVFTADNSVDASNPTYPLKFVMIEPAQGGPRTPVARFLERMGLMSRWNSLMKDGPLSSPRYKNVVAYSMELEGDDPQWHLKYSAR